mmetsp:Transcript_38827/g.89492  ORF Transcript_38827/g.89492 Transcript_38827/m.89492 type:complete len:385 (-) Transcript_38827:77-1231(-)
MAALAAPSAGAGGVPSSRLEVVAELEGHVDTVWSVAWSPSGKYLASCGSDKIIRIWGPNANDEAVWTCLASLEEGHKRTVRCCQWSPCSSYIASVSFDGTCCVWQHADEGGGGGHDSDEYDSDEAEGMSMGRREMRWELIAQLEGHENEVKSVSWNPEGTLLATCGRDKSVWIWETLAPAEFECLTVKVEHTQDVKYVQFHPRQQLLLSASYDDTVKVWAEDGDDWYCVSTLDAHSTTVWALACSPSAAPAERMVSVSDDGCIILWQADASGGIDGHAAWRRLDSDEKLHERPIFAVDWAAGGEIVTGGGDNAIRVFRVAENAAADSSGEGGEGAQPGARLTMVAEVKEAHQGDVNSVRWNPKQPGVLASAGDDQLIRIWTHRE